MFERLALMKKRYEEINGLIGRAEIVARQEEWRKLVKEHSLLQPVVDAYERYLKITAEMDDCQAIMHDSDKDMAEMAETEYYALREQKEKIIKDLKKLLIPVDPMDEKNVIIEIRAGAGGEEAALFGTELMRMYHRFAERLNWKIQDIDSNNTELGGIKEATFTINGKGAYSKMKYESGVHRVQRVPETESQGRVQTSTVTVAVLPETEEVDFVIADKDLRIDVFHSGGAGGQNVNKVESAVRITHLPTNTVVQCQNERSQLQNKELAMQMLRSKLYDYYQTQKDEEYAERRKNQIGTGDRSERIRTYNFQQGRITDHRIGFTAYNLPAFLDGDIFQLLEALSLADQDAKLSKIEN